MLHKVFTDVRPKYPLEGQGGVIMDADTKRFLQTQMIWIAISLAISLSLSFLLPFPLSLVAIIGVFIVMNYYIRRWQMRRMGMMGGGTSGAGFGGLFGAGSGGGGGGGVNYVCLLCGQRFKSGTCPRCGSKMKRADF
jgi:hypothetical protein